MGLDLVGAIRHDRQYLVVQHLSSYQLITVKSEWVIRVGWRRIECEGHPWIECDSHDDSTDLVVFIKLNNPWSTTHCSERGIMQMSKSDTIPTCPFVLFLL